MSGPGTVTKTPLKSIGARDILKLDFLKSGHLRKEGRLERSILGKIVGTWRQVFVVLRDGCCYVFDSDQSTQPKSAYSFRNYCRLECFAKPPELDYCFKLVPRVGFEMKEQCFAVSDENSRQEWLVAFYKTLHVANDFPEPFTVDPGDWTLDIFKRIGGHRYDYVDEDCLENPPIAKRRYSDMPTKQHVPVRKSRSLPPVPTETDKPLSQDEAEEDSESDVPVDSYDDCISATTLQPQPPANTKPKRRSPPPVPQDPVEARPVVSQGAYINMDLQFKDLKIDDVPLFEGGSLEAKETISKEAVGTFLIRKSVQSQSSIPYVLVVSGPEGEVQFRIYKQESDGIFITEGTNFKSLSELVAYHRNNVLSEKTSVKLAKLYGHPDF